MESQPLAVRYRHLLKGIIERARAENVITDENIYQEANKDIYNYASTLFSDNILPSSELRHIENIIELYKLAQQGKRSMILMEHYSNFDLPSLVYLLERDGGEIGKEIAEKLVAIAGMKLNEDNPYISAFAEAFSRIIIYPSRTLAAITDPDEYKIEEQRSRKINMASIRAMDKQRKEGKIILVFPSGTRYRAGHPETRRGVREIDSYLRLSDVMLLVSINGNCLRLPTDPADMMGDVVFEDRIIVDTSEIIECKKFRQDILDAHVHSDEDKKQVVVDEVMHRLLVMHEKNEIGRL